MTIPLNDILRAICFAGAIVSAALAIVWLAADLKSSNDALNEAADFGAAEGGAHEGSMRHD